MLERAQRAYTQRCQTDSLNAASGLLRELPILSKLLYLHIKKAKREPPGASTTISVDLIGAKQRLKMQDSIRVKMHFKSGRFCNEEWIMVYFYSAHWLLAHFG